MVSSISTATDTKWPADTIEWCPIEGHRDKLVCGTYSLIQGELMESGSQLRKGKCRLSTLQDQGSLESSILCELDFPAIPDSKWCHQTYNGNPLLAVADSEGRVSLVETKDQALQVVASATCVSNDVLCLSLDWRRWGPTFDHISDDNLLAVSCSDGNLALLQHTPSSFQVSRLWKGNDFEPWIVAWDRFSPYMLYSGGDDCKLKTWDIRTEMEQPVHINKGFEAGVTSVQSNPHLEHITAVGSYDSVLRIFDNRNLRSPLSSTNVGGGVWRIKFHPSSERKTDIALACMHDGFKVVHFDDAFGSAGVSMSFQEHKSLAYGVDWCWLLPNGEPARSIVASCSFYDHTQFLWRS